MSILTIAYDNVHNVHASISHGIIATRNAHKFNKVELGDFILLCVSSAGALAAGMASPDSHLMAIGVVVKDRENTPPITTQLWGENFEFNYPFKVKWLCSGSLSREDQQLAIDGHWVQVNPGSSLGSKSTLSGGPNYAGDLRKKTGQVDHHYLGKLISAICNLS